MRVRATKLKCITNMTETIAETGTSTKRYNDKREALVSAATRLFNERGVVGTTLAEVGNSVGLVKNSVTYYFRRKEDLAVACFDRAINAHDALVGIAVKQPDVAARVVELIRLHVLLQGEITQRNQPPVVSLGELRALPPPHVDELFARYTTMYRHSRKLLEGPETAHWSRADLNARAHLLVSFVSGIRTLVNRYDPEDHPRLGGGLSRIFLYGVNDPASAWAASGAELEWLSQIPERDLAAQFLRVATELINEQGYGGASVNKIAEKFNLTKGGFYYYNESKGDLIAQCFERSVGTIRKAVNLTETFGGQAWEHLSSIVRGLVRFQLSEDGPLLRSTANSAYLDVENRERVSTELGRVAERIAGVVVSGLMDGSIRPVDATLASHTVLTGIMAAAELRRWVRTANEYNSCDLYARPMLQGVLCPVGP